MSLSDSGSGLTDRIVLLKNLHRPLEEHWAGNKKVDALSSDYMFKHHITRLEKVYTTKDGKPFVTVRVERAGMMWVPEYMAALAAQSHPNILPVRRHTLTPTSSHTDSHHTQTHTNTSHAPHTRDTQAHRHTRAIATPLS